MDVVMKYFRLDGCSTVIDCKTATTKGSTSGIKGDVDRDVDLSKFHKKHSLYDILLPKHRTKKAPAADTTATKTENTKRDTTRAANKK